MQPTSLDYRCFNPLYPLYARKVGKGLCIVRIADESRIATVVVRDINLLVSYEWDQITGRHITVFFKDGTARIHDVFQGGKLISLLRIGTKTVDGGLWDRLERKVSADDCLPKLEHDITRIMPKMVRFARDTRQIFIVPYEPLNRAWRLATHEQDGIKVEKQITDIHLIHKEDGHLFLMFDGDYVLQVPIQGEPDPMPSRLQALFAAEKGLYYFFFQEGGIESLDLRPLASNLPSVNLIKCFITMTQLIRYLQNHLELIRNDLIAPYNEFLEKLCNSAYGYQQLHEELETLLLTGCVSPELEDWFCNTVNEKNCKKLRKLSLDLYQKGSQALTLAFIPACERLILLSEACRGLLSAIEVVTSGHLAAMSHISKLTESGQSILRLTLETIQQVKSQDTLFQTFWPWFDDRVHEALDEDYKPTLRLDEKSKTGHDIATYLDAQFKEAEPSVHLNELFKTNSLDAALNNFLSALLSVRQQQIEPHLLQNCITSRLVNILEKDEQPAKLLAAAPLLKRPLIVCFITGAEEKVPWLSMRLLNMSDLDRAAQDLPIQLPLGLEDRQVESLLILKVSDALPDPITARRNPATGSTRIHFKAVVPHLQEDRDQKTPAQELSYECEITADFHIASLMMHENPHS